MAIVKGAKKGKDEARQPVIATDSAQSKTYINILYGLAEGEVEGLANGNQSIFLEETPLQDANGNLSFSNVKVDFRKGTNDQDYIEGFPSVDSESAVDVELKSETPWVRAFNNIDLDAVRIRLKWGPLRKQDATTGDVSGITIEYAIDIQTDGGTWTEVLKTKITDKTSANYERAHRIDLPKADTGWLIRVRRITPNSTSEYVSDKMYVEAITEVVDVKLRYPNTSLLGIRYDAETFGNVAKIAVDLKGTLILVPTNYNPQTRVYTGIWDGTFKRAYTNNPAWIYYDLCTNDRYGLGSRLTPLMIDKWSLYRLAQYCDQTVSDGLGGQEPRFTCNVYLQSADEAFSILMKLAGVFRAIAFWDGNSINCDADIPQDTYFTYSRANVNGGVFEYSGTRARDRHNVVKVAWDNPANHYKTEYEYVRNEKAIGESGQVRILDLDAWGCTSRGQAQRAGHWALISEQKETRTVSFKVGLDGHIPLPGRVIEIADELFAGRANGGRVSKISTDLKSITLDRDDVVAKAGDRLVINGESGKAQTRIVQSISGRVVTVTLPFDANSIAVQNVWVLDAKDLATMKFRVISIAQDEKHQFSVTALQYNPLKFDEIDNGAFFEEAPISIVNPLIQDPVKDVLITSEIKVDQGINVTTMIVSWTQAKGAVKYFVEWRKDDGSWIRLQLTGNNSVEVPGVYSGKYQARVTAVSAFEISSLPASSILTDITGKQGLPPHLAFIHATGILFGMKLDWGFPPTGAKDTAYTEVQVSPDGTSNIAQLGLFAYPTTTNTIQGLQPNLKQFYRGRLIDRIGNIGPWSEWTNSTTTANPDTVLDLISGHITESDLAQELQGKIENTIEAAESAKSAATTAQTTADTAKTNAAIAQASANAAAAAASTADSKALAANNAAEAAQTSANTAQTTANTAKTNAATAQAAADAAKSSASTAQSTANIAKDNAATAQSAAVAAKTAADNAQTSATTANNDLAAYKTATNTQLQNFTTSLTTLNDGLTSEVQSRKDGDAALTSSINTYKGSNDAALAAVRTTAESAVSQGNSNATNITALTATLNTKNRTYRQNAAPTANLVVGDLWINTTSGQNNEMRRWNGSAWDVTTDPRTATNSSAITAIQTDVTTINGKVTTNASNITNLQSGLTDLTTAVGNKTDQSALTALDTKVTQQGNTLTSQGNAITGLQGSVTSINNALTTKADNSALTALTTRVTATETSISNQASQLTTLNANLTTVTNQVGTVKAYNVVTHRNASIGSGAPRGSGVYNARGTSQGNFGRGLTIVVFGSTGDFVSRTIYDVYGSLDTASADFATQIDGLAANTYFAVVGCDNISTFGTNAAANVVAARNTLLACGASPSYLAKWLGNSLPIFVGRKGLNSGNGIEVLLEATANNQWIDFPLTFVNGTPQGMAALGNLTNQLSATASALTSLTSTVTQQGNTLTTQSTAITNLQNSLTSLTGTVATKADASALSTLDSKVTQQGNTITTQGNQITSINNSLTTINNTLSTKADNTALTTLEGRVTSTESGLTTQSTQLTNLTARVDGIAVGANNLLLNTGSPSSTAPVKQAGETQIVLAAGITFNGGETISTAISTSGELYYRFSNPTSWDNGLGALIAGKQYTISGRVKKSEDMSSVRLRIGTSSNRTSFTDLVLKDTGATTDYVYFSETFVVPTNSVRVYLSLQPSGAHPVGSTFAFKDMQLEKGASASDWKPAPQDLATAAALTSLDTKVTQQGTTLTSQGTAITNLQNNLTNLTATVNTKADASALTTLDNKVTTQGNTITAQGNSITSLQNSVSTINTTLSTKADNSTLTALTTRVTATESGLTNQAGQITSLTTGLSTVTTQVGNTRSYTIRTQRGTTNTGKSNGFFSSTNVRQFSFSRGLHLFTFDATGSATFVGRYDTYSSNLSAASQELDSALTAIADGTYFGLVGCDHIGGFGTSTDQYVLAVKTHLINSGVTSAFLTKANNNYVPIIIARKGAATTSGVRNTGAVEIVLDSIWYEHNLSVVNGVPSGLNDNYFVSTQVEATATALTELTSTVTQQGNTITSQSGQITSLQNSVTSINTALATKADSSAVTNLTSRVTATEGQLTTQSGQITTLTNSLNSLTVGSTNLLAQSKLLKGYFTVGTGVVNTGGAYDRYDPNYYATAPSTVYCFTYYDNNGVTQTGSSSRVVWYDQDKNVLSLNQVQSMAYGTNKVTAPANAAFYRISTIAAGLKVKFEKGSIATDWSPSPDDVQDQITATANAVTTLQNTVTQQGNNITAQSGQITTINNSLTTINNSLSNKADNSALTALTTRVSSSEAGLTNQATQVTNLSTQLTNVRNQANNLVFDGSFERLTTTSGSMSPSSTARFGITSLKFTRTQAANNGNNNDITWQDFFDIADNRRYYLEIWARKDPDNSIVWNSNSRVTIGLHSNSARGSNRWDGISFDPSALTDDWVKISGYFLIPTGQTRARVWMSIPSSATNVQGASVLLDDLYIADVTEGINATETANSTATALTSLTANVNQQGNTITSQGNSITALQNSLTSLNTTVGTKADSSTVTNLNNTVTTQGNTLTTQGNAITQIQGNISTINNTLGTKADVSALNTLSGRVTSAENNISSQSTAITKVQSSIKANVASSGDLIPNPTFDPLYDQMGYTVLASTAAEVPTGCPFPYVARLAARDHFPAIDGIAWKVGDVIELSVLVASASNATAQFNLYVARMITPSTGLSAITAGGGQTPTQTWTRKTWNFTVTSSHVLNGSTNYPFFKPFLQIGQSSPFGSVWYVADWHVKNITAAAQAQATADATSTALSGLDSKVTQQGNTITSQGNSITSLQNSVGSLNTALSTKADSSVVSALTNRVTATETQLTTQSSQITSLQSSLNGLSVGGTNLLAKVKMTNGFINAATGADGVNTTHLRFKEAETLATRRTIVFSSGNSAVVLKVYPFVGDTYKGSVQLTAGSPYTFASDVTKFKVEVNGAGGNVETVSSYRLKLEYGSIATDWSPAPEDVQDQITATNSAISTLNTDMTSVKGSITSQGNNITSLQNNLSNLTNTVNTKADNSALTALTSRVTSTESSISSQSSQLTNLQSSINNLAVGGTNLLKNTANFGTDGTYQGLNIKRSIRAANATTYVDSYSVSVPNGIADGGFYIASFYARASKAQDVSCFFYSPDNTRSAESSTGQKTSNANGMISVTLTTEWKRYWVRWDAPANTSKGIVLARLNTQDTEARWVDVAGIQLEKGTLATDWSPAPEDLASSAALTSLSTTVTQQGNTLTSQSGQITTLQNSLTSLTGTVNNKADASSVTTLQNTVTQQGNTLSSVSSQTTTLQTTVNNQQSTIQQQAQTIDGIKARATLKLQSGDLIGGVGIENDSKTVDFIIQANKFAIAAPSTVTSTVTPKYAFTYQSTATTLPNGTVIPPGLYLDNASIGYINANKINAESLSALSANLGTLITYKDPSNPSGARMVMTGSLIQVYDDNNKLRVRLGLW